MTLLCPVVSMLSFPLLSAGPIRRASRMLNACDVDELARPGLFQPDWLSVLLPKRHCLTAPNDSAGDQGIPPLVNYSRADHLEDISFAKAQVLVTQEPRRGKVYLDGAAFCFYQQMSSFIPTDRAIEFLNVLHRALYSYLVPGAVSWCTMPGTGEHQDHEKDQSDAHDDLRKFHSSSSFLGVLICHNSSGPRRHAF